ncbi:Uncharacterised protein [Budvicia aquatica]|uniref:Uncharacterized protein n=1 Tax=Budvicia aquatica TaxID=82979 RepID=A0A484ZN67_9GAMM|nr:hypothetical protein [Budvicia aquatica]VFS49216.1 Uncharacterised protein [Budvicia aquatica]
MPSLPPKQLAEVALAAELDSYLAQDVEATAKWFIQKNAQDANGCL